MYLSRAKHQFTFETAISVSIFEVSRSAHRSHRCIAAASRLLLTDESQRVMHLTLSGLQTSWTRLEVAVAVADARIFPFHMYPISDTWSGETSLKPLCCCCLLFPSRTSKCPAQELMALSSCILPILYHISAYIFARPSMLGEPEEWQSRLCRST